MDPYTSRGAPLSSAHHLPPSLVTVENGFAFSNDGDDSTSDLSSLNTTPRKSPDSRKSPLAATNETAIADDGDDVDEADVQVSRSKANRTSAGRPRSQQQQQANAYRAAAAAAGRSATTAGRPCSSATSSSTKDPQQQQQPPPLQEVGGGTAVAGISGSNISHSRNAKLQDRKEKYRRMAAVQSRMGKSRIRVASSTTSAAAATATGSASSSARANENKDSSKTSSSAPVVLQSWKKQADQRKVAAERERPWFDPMLLDDKEEGPEDEQDELVQHHAPSDDDDDDVSPLRAKNHSFEEKAEENEESEDAIVASRAASMNNQCSAESSEGLVHRDEVATETLPEKEQSDSLFSANEQQRKSRSIVAVMKHKFEAEKNFSPPEVDIYGCPIFRVDSEESDKDDINDIDNDNKELVLEHAKAKLDELDTKIDGDQDDVTDSIKAMLSSASFFSKSAAQTLADASNEGAKLLGDAAQGVEELVLGPVKEMDESQVHCESEEEQDDAHEASGLQNDTNESEDDEDDDTEATPPPPPVARSSFPWRGRSPTPIVGSTNGAKGFHDDSATEGSFVLDDKSDVDVHYVLDDLASMATKKQETTATTKTCPAVEPAVPDEKTMAMRQMMAVDISSESELFVEDEGGASVDFASKDPPTTTVKDDKSEVKTNGDCHDRVMSSEAANITPTSDDLYDSLEVNTTDNALADETPTTFAKTTVANAPGIVSPDVAPKVANGCSHGSDLADEAVPKTHDKTAPTNREQGNPATQPGACVIRSAPTDETPESFDTTTASAAPTMEQPIHHVADSYSSVSSEELIPLPAAIATAVGSAGLVAAVTIPENEETGGPSPIIVSKVPDIETESEFPPTDDADVDQINFDSVSVKSEGTPVRGNLDDSREAPKAKTGLPKHVLPKPTKTKVVESKKKSTAPPETAPTTSKQTKASKTKEKQVHVSREASKISTSTISSISNFSTKETDGPKPAMVKTLDDKNGIAKGDIVLSLLNANLSEVNRAPKGSDQVRDAILRMRDMRKRQEKVELPDYEPDDMGTSEVDASAKRSALPVDVDDMRVVGAFDHVKTLEDDAIEHLKHDEIEAALELYEEIVSIYAEAFKETAKKRKKKLKHDHKAYIGAALHNIGILLLLKFNFEEALSFFEKAAENRKAHFGEGSVDHLASLGKIALCHYAMDEYETAHKSLEHVLELSKNHLAGLTDFMQVAEVLNNLGCLSFMCGQSGSAMTMFTECLEIQTAVLKQSLYSGPRFAGQCTSLSIAVTRGNIGYVQMLRKNAGAAIVEFEASLLHQQMILSDAHDTLICTMDHLAVANLLAKRKEEAIKMLGRMLSAQLAAYGPLDKRCVLTLSKLQLVQNEETDYLEKALDQLWNQHSKSASPANKAARVAATKKSNKMVKRFSFRKKVAKLNH